MLLKLILTIFLVASALSFSCLNEEGRPVDWWIILKTPSVKESLDEAVNDGVAYGYADAFNSSLKFMEGKRLDNLTSGPLSLTLQQLYGHSDDTKVAVGMYSDVSPKQDCGNCGSMKGSFVFDNDTGFWMIHSVSKFPDANSYKIPQDFDNYAESFLCLSMDFSQFDKMAYQLLIMRPGMYRSQLPAFAVRQPYLKMLSTESYDDLSVSNSTLNFRTSAGRSFTHFAKSNNRVMDLYQDIVSSALRDDLLVESWRSGVGSDSSLCQKAPLFDNINVNAIQMGPASWRYTKDNSKWAITKRLPYVCVGDLNRQSSQSKRAGGTMCLDDKDLWESWNEIIAEKEECSDVTSLASRGIRTSSISHSTRIMIPILLIIITNIIL